MLALRVSEGRAAAVCTEVLNAYGFDSIGILYLMGEILRNAGNSGKSTRRVLVCEMLV